MIPHQPDSNRAAFSLARHRPALLVVALALLSQTAPSQTPNVLQSTARPFGLDIVGPVMSAGSDSSSATFQESSLPQITGFINQSLAETKPFDASSFLLDPANLFLRTEADVRVYFIGEGAGNRNTLGFTTSYLKDSETPSLTWPPGNAYGKDKENDNNRDKDKDKDKGRGKDDGKGNNKDKDKDKDKDKGDNDTQISLPDAVGSNGLLIFPDASSPISSYDPASVAVRTQTAPLLPGDFVDLGRFESGTLLDFFLIANGAEGGTTTFSSQPSLNADGMNHVVAFAYGLKDSPYLLIGFEDLYGGGDRDFNDVLFAVDIGGINVAALTATPEPATFLILGGLIAFGVVLKRRMNRPTAP